MEPIRLHLGGTERRDGWTIVDIESRPEVDIVADVRELGEFADDSVSEIYASHVLEHLPFGGAGDALNEWFRVLAPGGLLRVAVPDLEIIFRLIDMPQVSTRGAFDLTRIVYGGQLNEHDFHKCGFTIETLSAVLEQAGFKNIRRVESFGMFRDCSEIRFIGQPISLNLEATK